MFYIFLESATLMNNVHCPDYQQMETADVNTITSLDLLQIHFILRHTAQFNLRIITPGTSHTRECVR